jgi:hypothetical protein
MGLRPLDLARWLEVDEHFAADLALKDELLAQRRDVVVAIDPCAREASEELLSEVRANLAQHHPTLPIEVRHDDDPLVAASRLVQEDLCVLVREDDWRLRAACICFPSRWDLATKLGATLDEIHHPVPGYHDQLSRPTNQFFDRLRAERSFWRLNWTLLDSPDLFQPVAARRAPAGGLDEWFFRVERQTLRALPLTGAVVFTIRTYVTSAQVLCEGDAAFTSTLLHALESAPTDVQTYKGWTGVAQRLRDEIAARES